MKDCIAIVNLDEKEEKLKELIGSKTISTMPIAGKYKVIDFILSNLTNSGVECIGIFSKRKSRDIIEHLNNGNVFDMCRKNHGIKMFNYSEYNPSYDDIHGFLENIEFFKYSKQEYIIMAPSHMVAYINYKEVLKKHKTSGYDVTVMYKKEKKPGEKFLGCEELIIDDSSRVKSIRQIYDNEENVNVNMKMYIMKTSLFIDIIKESITNGLYRKVGEYIKYNLDSLRVKAFEFNGYLSCINSVGSYFNTNQEILDIKINKELFNNKKPIYTMEKDDAPTYYSKESKVENSIIANGSYIEGKVENSILGKKVMVKRGVIVRNSVIMDNCIIESNTIVNNAIINSDIVIDKNKVVNGFNNYTMII